MKTKTKMISLFCLSFLVNCHKDTVVYEAPKDLSENITIKDLGEFSKDFSSSEDLASFDFYEEDVAPYSCAGKLIPFEFALRWLATAKGQEICEDKIGLVLALNFFCNKYCMSTFDNLGPFLGVKSCNKLGTLIEMPTYSWIECKY